MRFFGRGYGGVSWQTCLSPYLSQPPPPRPEGGGGLPKMLQLQRLPRLLLALSSHKTYYVNLRIQ